MNIIGYCAGKYFNVPIPMIKRLHSEHFGYDFVNEYGGYEEDETYEHDETKDSQEDKLKFIKKIKRLHKTQRKHTKQYCNKLQAKQLGTHIPQDILNIMLEFAFSPATNLINEIDRSTVLDLRNTHYGLDYSPRGQWQYRIVFYDVYDVDAYDGYITYNHASVTIHLNTKEFTLNSDGDIETIEFDHPNFNRVVVDIALCMIGDSEHSVLVPYVCKCICMWRAFNGW